MESRGGNAKPGHPSTGTGCHGQRTESPPGDISNLNAVNEKVIDLGKRQPYRDEIRAFLRGLQADFGA